MHIQTIHIEIVTQLEKLADTDAASDKRLEWFQQQHKGSEISSYGINLPEVRKLIKKFMPDFNKLDLAEKYSLAKLLYTSGNFEQATVADKLVELNFLDLTPDQYVMLDEVVGCFSNWASVDWMCLHGFQDLLLAFGEQTMILLREWNRADNIWKRRASVVAFVRKIGSSGDFTDEALELCDNLVWDDEEIVQKGVGWALKDSLPGDRGRVIEYIKDLRREGVSSVITLYAIRDLKGSEREDVLKVKATKGKYQ